MGVDLFVLRYVNGSASHFIDNMAVTLTSGFLWIPLYVFLTILVIKNNKTMIQILLTFCCGVVGVLLSGVLSDLIIKPIVMRPRPCNDPIYGDIVQTVMGYHASGYSFFSSHSANTFSLAMFFALLVRSRLLSITLFLWALTNVWTRLYLGVHWFTDVLVGMCWGMLVGAMVYYVYRKLFYRISPKVKYVSSQYSSTGYSHSDINMCVSVVVFTVTFAVIRSVIV